MKKLAQEAGLEGHCTPHTLRHTYATDMLKRGADITHIQKLLGHSSVNTTMIYADVNMDDCEADYRKRISSIVRKSEQSRIYVIVIPHYNIMRKGKQNFSKEGLSSGLLESPMRIQIQ